MSSYFSEEIYFKFLKPLPTNFNNIILPDMQFDLLVIVRANLEASSCFVDSPEYIKNSLPSPVFICVQRALLLYICLFLNLRL